jgi:hypothetical protein
MKIILAIILVVVSLTAAAYFGLPVLIDHQTASIKTEMKNLNTRL